MGNQKRIQRNQHVVITGCRALDEFIDIVDTATEMCQINYAYKARIRIQKCTEL